jgi:hypothetical protein
VRVPYHPQKRTQPGATDTPDPRGWEDVCHAGQHPAGRSP